MTIPNEADVPLASAVEDTYTAEQLIVEIRDLDKQIKVYADIAEARARSRYQCELVMQKMREDLIVKFLILDDIPVADRPEYKNNIVNEVGEKLEVEMEKVDEFKKQEQYAMSRVAVLEDKRDEVYGRLIALL